MRVMKKTYPPCKELVRLSKRGEKVRGLASAEKFVCTFCEYTSPAYKFYDEVEGDGPGQKIAVPNMAVQAALFNNRTYLCQVRVGCSG
ncbi:Hypp6760 [Branchiostoma lanceolatum]|uniref:Hypp6760 protein n=1 Tax=Branchiostoma lanceolatum TaxID=7740 RepID=A0A8J9YVJ3_BRALA|nr:Hypp6760 [Branchiostoma lanceolatum]